MNVLKGSRTGRRGVVGVSVVVSWLVAGVAVAQLKPANGRALSVEERMLSVREAERQEWVDQAVGNALRDFETLKFSGDQVAVTLLEWRDGAVPAKAAYRGDAAVAAAGVARLFYLTAAEHELENGRLQETGELKRAMTRMMEESQEDATGLVVDLVTRTKGGPELSATDLERWHEGREGVNRYFTSLGYKNINIDQKPSSAKPYGREAQALIQFKPTRNLLTTDATAQLMREIVTGKVVSPVRCEVMKSLMQRDLGVKKKLGREDGFIGAFLPEGAKCWSVGGLTETLRHDAAYVELPNGEKFVLVIFTVWHAEQTKILGNITRDIVRELGKEK